MKIVDITKIEEYANVLSAMGFDLLKVVKEDEGSWFSCSDGHGSHWVASGLHANVNEAMLLERRLRIRYAGLGFVGWYKGMIVFHAGVVYANDEIHRDMLLCLANAEHSSNGRKFHTVELIFNDDMQESLVVFAADYDEAEKVAIEHLRELYGSVEIDETTAGVFENELSLLQVDGFRVCVHSDLVREIDNTGEPQ